MARQNRCSRLLSSWARKVFELDLYAYAPGLQSTAFTTWVSLLVSAMVTAAFLFCVAYTLFLWITTEMFVFNGETVHMPAELVPETFKGRSALPLPQAGLLLRLSNGTTPIDPALVKIQWKQAIICSGDQLHKVEEPMPSRLCEFRDPVTHAMRTNLTICPDWEDAHTVLGESSSTARDLCQVRGVGNRPYVVPRVAGTFFDKEYAYITATLQVNASAFLTNPATAANVFGGAAQLFLQFPYTASSTLREGRWPSGEEVGWSRRVNLLANTSMKWELSLRVRRIRALSFWWDIPQLESKALDFTVTLSEVSLSSNPKESGGFVEVAKIFLKMDDRDDEVIQRPYTNLFNLFADWGGFLSILVAVGLPAAWFNEYLFRASVKKLMRQGVVVFDEQVRKHRAGAMVQAFSHGVEHVTSLLRGGAGAGAGGGCGGASSKGGVGPQCKAVEPYPQGSGDSGRTSDPAQPTKEDVSESSSPLPLLPAAQPKSSFYPDIPPSSLPQQISASAALGGLGAALGRAPALPPQGAGDGGPGSAAAGQGNGHQGAMQAAAPSPPGGMTRAPAAMQRGGTSFNSSSAGADLTVHPELLHAGLASILVKYDADVFADSDEEGDSFEDVQRHCTSECQAQYHLRQVALPPCRPAALPPCRPAALPAGQLGQGAGGGEERGDRGKGRRKRGQGGVSRGGAGSKGCGARAGGWVGCVGGVGLHG